MKMEPVQSSNIAAVGHDGDAMLAIEFHGGTLWHYSGVSKEEYEALKMADSIGSHFHRFIKMNPSVKATRQERK